MSTAPLADPFVPQIYRIARATPEDADTVTFDLMPPTGETAPFLPGQFNMLYAFGVGEVAISMSGDPAGKDRFVHTVRAVGSVSRAVTALKTGGLIGVRGPFGSAWPMKKAEGKDVVIVAGGLGLAPLRPAIYDILARRDKFGRVVILVGMRNPPSILYRDELEQWRSRPDIDIEVTVDRADATWHGNVGVVPELIARMSFDPKNAIAMTCGPEIMMRFTLNALCDAGISPDRIFLSMERNMKCAIGLCGHCQFGPYFVCKDGPVLQFDRVAGILSIREI
ncbi:MAG: FAD/NAD(P)-binding protein [Rhizomicrobium sp.]